MNDKTGQSGIVLANRTDLQKFRLYNTYSAGGSFERLRVNVRTSVYTCRYCGTGTETIENCRNCGAPIDPRAKAEKE